MDVGFCWLLNVAISSIDVVSSFALMRMSANASLILIIGENGSGREECRINKPVGEDLSCRVLIIDCIF